MPIRSERFKTPVSAEAGAVDLHVLHWGEVRHPKLVLLHGGGANAHWWDHLAPQLAERFHVLALDFRGHGDSERPQELVPGAFGADLAALLEHLDIRNAVLVGHSMGAQVALEHAVRRGTARALALIDPARGAGTKGKRRMRLALSFRRTYATRSEAVDRFRFLPPAERTREVLRRHIAEASVEQEADGRWGYKFDPRWFGLPSAGPLETLQLQCPTLILRGADSAILTEAGAQRLQAEIAGSELRVIPNAGHHVQLDQPEAVLDALAAFLDGLAPVDR